MYSQSSSLKLLACYLGSQAHKLRSPIDISATKTRLGAPCHGTEAI